MMAKEKFDWTSVGGRPAGNNQMQSIGSQKFDWGSVGGRPANVPIPEATNQQNLNDLQGQHPYLYKLAQMLQGNPTLAKAGDIAGHINAATEGTGLPSLARGFLGTGIEMGRGLTNLIPGVKIPKQELSSLNVNPYVGEAAETLGSLGMGLPVFRGYQATKKGIEAIPYAKKIPNIIRNILAGSVTASALSPENRSLAAALGGAAETFPPIVNKIKDVFQNFNVKGKENEFLNAMLEHERQKATEKAMKEKARYKFKTTSPEGLLMSTADKEAQLKAAQDYQRNRMGEQKMLPGEQLVPEAEHGVRNVDQVLRQTLGEGEPNIQRLSKEIVDAVEGQEVVRPHPRTGLPRTVREGGLREEIGKKYDELGNSLPDINVPSHDIKAVEKELNQLIGAKSDVTDEEKDKLRKILAESHPSSKNKIISGKTFFNAYRSMRKLEGEQRSKAFGLDPKSFDEWQDRANETKKAYEKMEDTIRKHFPEGTIKKLDEINHEYSTRVAPLNENSLYQKMKSGSVGSATNVLHFLSGTTKGNNILNNLITNSPEWSRMLLGHHYAENPAKLLKPKKIIEPYVNANPEISRLLGLQKQAQTQLETAHQNAEHFKQVENIPKLIKDIAEQKKLAQRLKIESEATGQTKGEAAKKKVEYEKAQQRKKHLIKILANAGIPFLSAGAGGYVTYKNLHE